MRILRKKFLFVFRKISFLTFFDPNRALRSIIIWPVFETICSLGTKVATDPNFSSSRLRIGMGSYMNVLSTKQGVLYLFLELHLLHNVGLQQLLVTYKYRQVGSLRLFFIKVAPNFYFLVLGWFRNIRGITHFIVFQNSVWFWV